MTIIFGDIKSKCPYSSPVLKTKKDQFFKPKF